MYPELKSQLYQGDIMLPVSRNSIISDYYKWPKAVVPYTIHSNFSKYILKYVDLYTSITEYNENGNKRIQYSI